MTDVGQGDPGTSSLYAPDGTSPDVVEKRVLPVVIVILYFNYIYYHNL